jgi:hypothetical protein
MREVVMTEVVGICGNRSERLVVLDHGNGEDFVRRRNTVLSMDRDWEPLENVKVFSSIRVR